MTPLFDAMVDWQKRALETQRSAHEAGAALVAAQEATRRAAEANWAAWQAWVRLWRPAP